jgi:hypothetical protein
MNDVHPSSPPAAGRQILSDDQAVLGDEPHRRLVSEVLAPVDHFTVSVRSL